MKTFIHFFTALLIGFKIITISLCASSNEVNLTKDQVNALNKIFKNYYRSSGSNTEKVFIKNNRLILIQNDRMLFFDLENFKLIKKIYHSNFIHTYSTFVRKEKLFVLEETDHGININMYDFKTTDLISQSSITKDSLLNLINRENSYEDVMTRLDDVLFTDKGDPILKFEAQTQAPSSKEGEEVKQGEWSSRYVYGDLIEDRGHFSFRLLNEESLKSIGHTTSSREAFDLIHSHQQTQNKNRRAYIDQMGHLIVEDKDSKLDLPTSPLVVFNKYDLHTRLFSKANLKKWRTHISPLALGGNFIVTTGESMGLLTGWNPRGPIQFFHFDEASEGLWIKDKSDERKISVREEKYRAKKESKINRNRQRLAFQICSPLFR